MARLFSFLKICASATLTLGAVIDPLKVPDPGVNQRRHVIARQDEPPVAAPSGTMASTMATVTTPPEIQIPGVAIAAIEPTAPGQIGVNPPTTPKIELHTSFTEEPMTVTLKDSASPTVAPALVTAVVAEGYLNIGLAPELADKLQEIAKQIPPCGAAVAKRNPPPAPLKVKGRQVTGPACGFDGFASRVAQESELTDWALLEAQLDQALTEAMNFAVETAGGVIQLVSSADMTAVWASLSSQSNIVTAGAGLITWQLFKTLYESLHVNAVSSMKGIAIHAESVTKTETDYKTDEKQCKKEEQDRPKCKKDDCKGDKNNFCTTGDQSGCPCRGSEIKQIGQMRPPAYVEAVANLPIITLFGEQNVVKAPECDSTARFNYPLNDWKVMALAFSDGPAKDLTKEAITAYNGTYKFTFGWFPKSGSQCSTTSVNPMLNYMVDDPALNCREGSVDDTIFGSGKMETDCGTIKWSIKMPDNTVIVPPVINDPPPTTGLDATPRFCYDPKAESWTGKNVVKATLEEQAKKACEAFAAKGPYEFKPDTVVRLYPVPKPAGVTTDYILGVLYGFRLDWNRGREGCSAEELGNIPGGSLQEILPVEGDGSCSALMVQAWEKCDAQYGGNMGGFYDVGCLQYSFRPDNPMPHTVPKTPLKGGDD
ncbi:hypothetical protein V8F20_004180 [Naviculisporaceae sp. PSN 640]